MQGPLSVKATWHAEASVWVAESDDVPGLVTEAATMEELVAKLKGMIPELLEASGVEAMNPESRGLYGGIRVDVVASRRRSNPEPLDRIASSLCSSE